jgi:glycerol kinase
MGSYILAIDQGTTSTRALLFDESATCLATANSEIPQYFPRPGWVEHDPLEIWQSVQDVVSGVLQAVGLTGNELTAIGVTNQRETVVLWDRGTGRPIHRALVWQDRRTTDFCRQHQSDEPWLSERTGLVLDPYFSATKIRWLLDQDAGLRAQAAAGRLACGTIDSWLIWNLTGGRLVTDVTNASRTLLLNIQTGQWDDELCRYFDVPRALLPEVKPSAADFGKTQGLSFLPDFVPIAGVAGDQQAALFGQCGFQSGAAKCTYGTGAFFLQHTGTRRTVSRHGLLTSLAATTGADLEYVLEGSVFVAGAAVQWLRDGLKLFTAAGQVEQLAAQSDLEQPILFVPGFVGLGAPHWVPEVQGTIFGLTRATTTADLGRAALEGVAFQVNDLVEAAGDDTSQPLQSLRVDGGMARNAWFLQCQADILGLPVSQAVHAEATALGAAYLAGLHVGVWPSQDSLRHLPQQSRRFEPLWPADRRQRRVNEWRRAVEAVIAFYGKRPAAGE